MSTSSFVAWETIRRSDSRAIKKSVGTFSTDPMSLTGKHSFSNSSVQAKAVGVRAVKKAGAAATRFVLATKVAGKANKPKQSIKTAKMGVRAGGGRGRGGGGGTAARLSHPAAPCARLKPTRTPATQLHAPLQTHKKAARVANIVTMGAAKPIASSTAYRQDQHQAVMSRFSTLQRAEKRRIAKTTRRHVAVKKVKA